MDGQQPSSGKKAGGKRSVAGRPKVGKKKTPAETPAKKHRRSTTKRKWNEKDIADVITLVEKNRVFYDTSHVDYYKAKDKRLDIWEDMAKELKLEKTGEDVKKLWTNLRRNFGKKLKKHFGKKLKKHGTARQATIETWPHWDSMQFFRDYITPTEFSLSDGTTDDEGDNNDGTGDDTSLAANAIIDIPNPPSVQSSTASTLSSASKPKRNSSGLLVSQQVEELNEEEKKLVSQADELTKALGVIGAKSDSPEAQYGYVT